MLQALNSVLNKLLVIVTNAVKIEPNECRVHVTNKCCVPVTRAGKSWFGFRARENRHHKLLYPSTIKKNCSEPFSRRGLFTQQVSERRGQVHSPNGLLSEWDKRQGYGPAYLLNNISATRKRAKISNDMLQLMKIESLAIARA